jgi:hypothetical protein
MTPSHPPLLATRLLEHLRSGKSNEFLVGDLMEEYGRRGSKVWYWRQVLAAIITSFCKDVRANALLAIKATVTGWAASYLFQSLAFGMVSRFHLWSPLYHELPQLFGYGIAGLLTWSILWTPVWVGSGWYVGRLYRSQLQVMVLMFAVSVVVWKLLRVAWTIHHSLNATGDLRYFPRLIVGLMNLLLPSVYIVLGGWIASRSRCDYLASQCGRQELKVQ